MASTGGSSIILSTVFISNSAKKNVFFSYSCFYFSAMILHFGLACCFGAGTDTITINNPINRSRSLLVSANETFALGFFTSNGSSHGKQYQYVGIWYYRVEPQIIVWVANRDTPVSNSTNWVFGIGDDGNLKLSDGTGLTKTLTNLDGVNLNSSLMTLKLLDSGNLVLSEGQDNESTLVWQSFSHPTDTFLPGMKIRGLRLTSWTSQHDPAPGRFVFRQASDIRRQYIITDNEAPYWKSGLSGNFIINDDLPLYISVLLNTNGSKGRKQSNCSFLLKNRKNCSETLIQSKDYKYSRLVTGFDGKLRFFTRDNLTDEWSSKWMEPSNICNVFDACGKFGSCSKENRIPCKCLPGFTPQSPDSWNNGDFSEGCIRRNPVCSGHGTNDEQFLKLSKMKLEKPHSVFAVNDKNECKSRCLEKCTCLAYSYHKIDVPFLRDRQSNVTCGIWHEYLNHVQESYTDTTPGLDLYLRVHGSEMGNRTCDPCGTNIIPYPLSTGTSCGDPNYFNFDCQTETDTGLLSFNASNRTYRISSIDPEKRTFSIQVEKKCRPGDSTEKLLQLPKSSPFFVNSNCKAIKNNSSAEFLSEDKWFYEVEIVWKPPLEPLCGSSDDCRDLRNSSCNVAADGKKRCQCNPPFQWNPSEGGCIPVLESYFKPRGPLGNQTAQYLIFLGVCSAILFLLCIAFALYRKRRRRTVIRRRGNLELSLYNIERWVTDFIHSGEFKEDDKKDIDVPYFDLETILIATDNFSEANKLGQGGFGPVYKGKLPRGQEIAIKRLSRGSGQGLEEFKNEVVLIAKLQHRNLVRLLGYCVKGYEKMLIYEYMPNKSLDSFIFDRTRCVLLNWEKRMDIILGIARGLLYLHQDSRLRIIHRDLKTSNILLDEDMAPKISDFGLAKIFGGRQTEDCTNRVVGTYGYMSPEYALDGFFSIKSDVFSFGVVLLETITGKRNTGFYQAEQPLSLLGYAWRLWNNGRVLDLADLGLRQTCDVNEFARYINVGLLCVQEDPNDRPTMSNVLFMLGSETPSLPFPKQPAFVVRRSLPSSSSSSSTKQLWNIELTNTLEEGR